MFDVTIQQLLYRAAAWLILAGVHGWALAAAARVLGDRGVRHDGRSTANPVPHLDVVGLVAALLFRTGWIRPLSVDLGGGARGAARRLAAAVGGLLAVPVLALAVRAVRPTLFTWLPTSASIPVLAFADTLIAMSLRFVALNVVPAPPLTLGHLWGPPRGRRGARAWLAITWVVRILVLVALATGAANVVVLPTERWLGRLIGFR